MRLHPILVSTMSLTVCAAGLAVAGPAVDPSRQIGANPVLPAPQEYLTACRR